MFIQGAATHSCLSAHYQVKDELEELIPNAMRKYDTLAIGFELQYWSFMTGLLMGRPKSFWKKVHHDSHPFCKHPILAKHGAALSEASHTYLKNLAKKKKLFNWPFSYFLKMNWEFIKLIIQETDQQNSAEFEAGFTVE